MFNVKKIKNYLVCVSGVALGFVLAVALAVGSMYFGIC